MPNDHTGKKKKGEAGVPHKGLDPEGTTCVHINSMHTIYSYIVSKVICFIILPCQGKRKRTGNLAPTCLRNTAKSIVRTKLSSLPKSFMKEIDLWANKETYLYLY